MEVIIVQNNAEKYAANSSLASVLRHSFVTIAAQNVEKRTIKHSDKIALRRRSNLGCDLSVSEG